MLVTGGSCVHGRHDDGAWILVGEPVAVEGEGEPEADVGVGDDDAGEDEDAEAGEKDESGVEAGSGGEGAAGEAFEDEGEERTVSARGRRAEAV